jgi:hypothetical protein
VDYNKIFRLREGPGSGVDITLVSPSFGKREGDKLPVIASNVIMENYYDSAEYNERYGCDSDIVLGYLDVSGIEQETIFEFNELDRKGNYTFMIGGGYTHSINLPNGEVDILYRPEDSDNYDDEQSKKVEIIWTDEYIGYVWDDLWNPEEEEDEELMESKIKEVGTRSKEYQVYADGGTGHGDNVRHPKYGRKIADKLSDEEARELADKISSEGRDVKIRHPRMNKGFKTVSHYLTGPEIEEAKKIVIESGYRIVEADDEKEALKVLKALKKAKINDPYDWKNYAKKELDITIDTKILDKVNRKHHIL